MKKLNHLAEIYNSYDTFVIDLWGVVHNGVNLNIKAIAAIENLISNKKKVVFLTNAPRPSFVIKKHLLNLGMKEDLLKNIMSSGEASMQELEKERFGKLFFHLGPDKDNEIFTNIKKNKTTLEKCDFILCTGLIEDKEEDLDLIFENIDTYLYMYRNIIGQVEKYDKDTMYVNKLKDD